MGSGRSLGQSDDLGPALLPREMERVCGTNMGAGGKPSERTSRRRLPRVLPASPCTSSARSRGNSSLKEGYCHGVGITCNTDVAGPRKCGNGVPPLKDSETECSRTTGSAGMRECAERETCRCLLVSVFACVGVCLCRCLLVSVFARVGVCSCRCLLVSMFARVSLCSRGEVPLYNEGHRPP